MGVLHGGRVAGKKGITVWPAARGWCRPTKFPIPHTLFNGAHIQPRWGVYMPAVLEANTGLSLQVLNG